MTLNEKDPRSRSHWPPLGWEAGSPQAHGMKDELLWSADETIRRGLPNVYSRLVVRNSTIVFEQYYQGHAATSLFDIRSATKSFISALIGIAVKEKQIPNLDQPILSYFPEYKAANMDPRKAAITIRDLLVMKSGLAWDEERDCSGFFYHLGLDITIGHSTRWAFHLVMQVCHLRRATSQNSVCYTPVMGYGIGARFLSRNIFETRQQPGVLAAFQKKQNTVITGGCFHLRHTQHTSQLVMADNIYGLFQIWT